MSPSDERKDSLSMASLSGRVLSWPSRDGNSGGQNEFNFRLGLTTMHKRRYPSERSNQSLKIISQLCVQLLFIAAKAC